MRWGECLHALLLLISLHKINRQSELKKSLLYEGGILAAEGLLIKTFSATEPSRTRGRRRWGFMAGERVPVAAVVNM